MKKILFISALLFSFNGWAEPKQLICISDVSAEEEGERQRSNGNYDLAEICKNSDFARKHIFVFDTNGLKNPVESNVEYTFIYACGIPEDTKSKKMTHTPSVISFAINTYKSGSSFNVDRKTLRSGFGTSRNHSCSLEDIDTSENIL